MKTIVTLTAPTCSGKSTLERALVAQGCAKVTSHTTRQPRAGEIDGVDYYFVKEDFFGKNRSGFVERVAFDGNYYGVHQLEINKLLDSHAVIILVAEPKGVHQIQQWCKSNGVECVSCYLQTDKFVRYKHFLERLVLPLDSKGVSAQANRLLTMEEEEGWYRKWNFCLKFKMLERLNKTPEELALEVLSVIGRRGRRLVQEVELLSVIERNSNNDV